jgi:hypothetical protein
MTTTATTTTTTARPATCGAYVTANIAAKPFLADRLVTCKRLPMHKDACRAHLTIAAEHKANKPAKKSAAKKSAAKKSPVTRKDLGADLAAQVESGAMTAGDALSKMAAFITRASKRTVRVSKPRSPQQQGSAVAAS